LTANKLCSTSPGSPLPDLVVDVIDVNPSEAVEDYRSFMYSVVWFIESKLKSQNGSHPAAIVIIDPDDDFKLLLLPIPPTTTTVSLFPITKTGAFDLCVDVTTPTRRISLQKKPDVYEQLLCAALAADKGKGSEIILELMHDGSARSARSYEWQPTRSAVVLDERGAGQPLEGSQRLLRKLTLAVGVIERDDDDNIAYLGYESASQFVDHRPVTVTPGLRVKAIGGKCFQGVIVGEGDYSVSTELKELGGKSVLQYNRDSSPARSALLKKADPLAMVVLVKARNGKALPCMPEFLRRVVYNTDLSPAAATKANSLSQQNPQYRKDFADAARKAVLTKQITADYATTGIWHKLGICATRELLELEAESENFSWDGMVVAGGGNIVLCQSPKDGLTRSRSTGLQSWRLMAIRSLRSTHALVASTSRLRGQ
jgi:hypothetical protein